MKYIELTKLEKEINEIGKAFYNSQLLKHIGDISGTGNNDIEENGELSDAALQRIISGEEPIEEGSEQVSFQFMVPELKSFHYDVLEKPYLLPINRIMDMTQEKDFCNIELEEDRFVSVKENIEEIKNKLVKLK